MNLDETHLFLLQVSRGRGGIQEKGRCLLVAVHPFESAAGL